MVEFMFLIFTLPHWLPAAVRLLQELVVYPILAIYYLVIRHIHETWLFLVTQSTRSPDITGELPLNSEICHFVIVLKTQQRVLWSLVFITGFFFAGYCLPLGRSATVLDTQLRSHQTDFCNVSIMHLVRPIFSHMILLSYCHYSAPATSLDRVGTRTLCPSLTLDQPGQALFHAQEDGDEQRPTFLSSLV